jgi:hypothetical protein
VAKQVEESTSLNEVDDAITALTLQDHSTTVTATLVTRHQSPNHDIDHSPIRTIILTVDPSTPSSSGSSSTTIANASPRHSSPPATFPSQALIPLHAEHDPPPRPVALCLAHPIWTLSMRLCNYSPASIKQAHYFTKSIVYYPDWKIRVISKNEHRLVPSSSSSTSTQSTNTDTATSASTDTPTPIFPVPVLHISTRPLWALQFYYGGPARPPWDEVIPASWTGAELDTAVELQELWIEKILRLITQAQRADVRADTGREVRVVSDSQLGMNTGSLVEGGGAGDGGAFAVVIFMLGQACEALEGLLGRVDAGGPRNWEAERDLREGVRKYAGRGRQQAR